MTKMDGFSVSIEVGNIELETCVQCPVEISSRRRRELVASIVNEGHHTDFYRNGFRDALKEKIEEKYLSLECELCGNEMLYNDRSGQKECSICDG